MKNKVIGLLIASIIIILVVFIIYILIPKKKFVTMIDLSNKSVEEINDFVLKNHLNLEIEKEYSNVEKDKIIDQNILEGTLIKENDNLKVIVSLGIDYEALKVNELGAVPVMMYHGIHNRTDNKYTGGNIDKDGYQRTTQAFEQDLEFYYTSGYRMIRLEDYVNGIIDVPAGKSPIVLTFDDGLSNNIKVTGLDEDGNIIIDPASAVGVLEAFKKKYPDFNVTATFFVNGGLFNQSSYNEKILNWLVDNGYDIGNHSYSHADFTKITQEKAVQEIGSVYNLLDKYIEGKYVSIVALPFGSPYKKDHANFSSIVKGIYNDKSYETISTLRVGWESNYSPFNKLFDKQFIKRIRAYDNNGKDFDIEDNFKELEKSRYISDGDIKTIAIPKDKEEKLNNVYDLKVVTY